MYLRQVLTIAAKDLRAEMRTRESLYASFSFMLTILVLFSFAFDPENLDINIQAIATSEIKVSCLIASKYTELAVRALHDGFGLAGK